MKVKLALGFVFIVLAAGCSSEVRGVPDPAGGTSGTPSSTTGAGPAVPNVANPINTTRFEKEPCAALTTDQLTQLGISTTPKPDLDDKLGPNCEWNAYDEVGLTVHAQLLTGGNGSSLAKTYQQHEQGQWKYFEPVADIAGYPAVLVDPIDAQPKDKCDAAVAVRDDLIYSVQATISSDAKKYSNPCEAAKKAAELAVTTMKAG